MEKIFKEQILESMRESNRQNLRIGVQEPYFGRLDFQEDGKEEVMPIYIGKSRGFGYGHDEANHY